MIWINFDKWHNGADYLFTKKRIYIKKYKWTPFIKLNIRYKDKDTRIRNFIYGAPEKLFTLPIKGL